MSSKWADYIITAVRYNKDHDYIELVRICEDLGDKIGGIVEEKRISVVNLLNTGKTIITAIKNSDNKWKKGEDVRIFDEKYIRTDPNGTKKDNLGSIPEF